MSEELQTYLPGELVQSILIRMWDPDNNWRPLKRGLTSCSLTCRHWASLIRPLLFSRLTIRSAEDISQLVALLDGADILDPSLRDCIQALDIIDDRTLSSIPWNHQILVLYRRIPRLPWEGVKLTITNDGVDSEINPGRHSSRPFAIIPRTLPGSVMPLLRLTLSHLRLPSARSLANCVEHMCIYTIWLKAVTFAKEDIPDIQRRRPHTSYPMLTEIVALQCFEDIAGLQRWFKITNVLYACQGRLRVDDAKLMLIEKCILLLLSCSQRWDRAGRLSLSTSDIGKAPYMFGWDEGSYPHVAPRYMCSVHDADADHAWNSKPLAEVVASLPANDRVHPYIDTIEFSYTKAASDSFDVIQQWAIFETALMDLVGASIPLVMVRFPSKDTAKEILALLLSGRILPELHGHLKMVSLFVDDDEAELYLHISPDDILLAPTQITLDGETISLDTTQRAEWLLSRGEFSGTVALVKWDKREEYAWGLLRAARALAVLTNVGDKMGRSALEEVRCAALGRTQGTTGEEESGDEEDTGLDE